MTPFVIALLVAAVGAVVHFALDNKASEIGRAMLWCGVLVALLVVTGVRI